MPLCVSDTDHDNRSDDCCEHCDCDDCVCHVSIVPDTLLFVKCVGCCLLVQLQVRLFTCSASRVRQLSRMMALTPHNDCLAVEQIHNYQGCESDDDDCVNGVHDSLCSVVLYVPIILYISA